MGQNESQATPLRPAGPTDTALATSGITLINRLQVGQMNTQEVRAAGAVIDWLQQIVNGRLVVGPPKPD